jgi:Putative transposase of IS4/5 family (DUF4096)
MRFDLSDEDWALLEPLLPKSRKSARVDDRKIMNVIFYVLRTGMPWRDLPARYGPYTTAYTAVSEIVKWSSVMKSTLQPLHLKTLTSGSSNKPSIVRATTIGREQFGQSGDWGCIFPTDRTACPSWVATPHRRNVSIRINE